MMDKSLFRYVWTHSRRDQIVILAFVLGSLPFYFMSLDLPKRIINDAIQGRAFASGVESVRALDFTIAWPSWMGGGKIMVFDGLQVDQAGLLFALSFVFLALVLINGAFKYVINIQKGVLGERMLRRMRFDLFAILLRFPPEEMRAIKPAEAASMIKDEVEPIGGFIGDAFIQPAFLGTQALTALAFIMIQNIWLGLIAGGVVAAQAVIIPYLRREQIRLGKQRQLASRKLAGRVGEIVDGVSAVRNHGVGRFEEAEIGGRLGELFLIRLKLFKRKFAVKYLNNLLAQLTPFFFYTIGGWFALKGQLDIGQLVAVIAAYRDLPPPVKELIDWDQQRVDVTVKYEQVIAQFSPARPLPVGEEPWSEEPDELALVGLGVVDPRGAPMLEHASATIALPAHIALVGHPGSGRDAVAGVLGRRLTLYSGVARLGGRDLNRLSDAQAGAVIAYVGEEPKLFPGSIRDNIVYGLRRRRPPHPTASDAQEKLRLRESLLSGNPPHRADDAWIDYAAAGVAGPEELDRAIVETLSLLRLDEDVYRFGLSGRIDGSREPDLAARLTRARRGVAAALAAEGKTDLVESFDPARYNRNATIGENLLFGVPVGEPFAEANLARNAFARAILDAEELTGPLAEIGLSIAATTVEMFAGLPGGHPLFERYSFIMAGDLASFEELIARWRTRRRADLAPDDADRLMSLAFAYAEPRHRLGLLTPEIETQIVKARISFRDMIAPELAQFVDFYDPDRHCDAAPIRDNLLFGRVAYGVAGAAEKVSAVMSRVLAEEGLRESIFRIGLDYQIGAGGKLLFGPQRSAIEMAACLIRRPRALIVDDALRGFPAAEAKALRAALRSHMAGRTLVLSLGPEEQDDGFDARLVFEGPRLTTVLDRRAGEAGLDTGPASASIADDTARVGRS